MDEAEARARLELLVAASSDPALDAATIDYLVAAARRVDEWGNSPTNIATAPVWTPATAYEIGDVVTADPADGRWWRAATSGTSGATEPSWPDLGTSPGPYGATVSDGLVLVWEDAGRAWTPTWDLNSAAALGWEAKAALAAGRYDFTTDGQTFRRGQIIAHCQTMAQTFRRKTAASAQVVKR